MQNKETVKLKIPTHGFATAIFKLKTCFRNYGT